MGVQGEEIMRLLLACAAFALLPAPALAGKITPSTEGNPLQLAAASTSEKICYSCKRPGKPATTTCRAKNQPPPKETRGSCTMVKQ